MAIGVNEQKEVRRMFKRYRSQFVPTELLTHRQPPLTKSHCNHSCCEFHFVLGREHFHCFQGASSPEIQDVYSGTELHVPKRTADQIKDCVAQQGA